MTEFERFAEALAKTESLDSELCWGDPKRDTAPHKVSLLGTWIELKKADFMAMGRWQIHPSWYHDWVPLKVPVDASWDEMFRQALEAFWNSGVGVGDDALTIAMKFHLGVAAVRERHWDDAYAMRFSRFYFTKTEES